MFQIRRWIFELVHSLADFSFKTWGTAVLILIRPSAALELLKAILLFIILIPTPTPLSDFSSPITKLVLVGGGGVHHNLYVKYDVAFIGNQKLTMDIQDLPLVSYALFLDLAEAYIYIGNSNVRLMEGNAYMHSTHPL